MNPYKLATEVAKESISGALVFRVSEQLAGSMEDEWSPPVQFRFQPNEDGTYELVVRKSA